MTWEYCNNIIIDGTRTTRTPAFWGYPPPPHDYPYHWVILDPKSKEDKVKVSNLKKYAKISIFLILKWALHATHLLKLLDKMCKYEMDLMSIVEDTERTRFCPQMDRRTDGRTDRRTRWYQYTPLSTSLKRGYNDGEQIFPLLNKHKVLAIKLCNSDSTNLL